jgi:hypothetical protein
MQLSLGRSDSLEKSKSQVPHKFPSLEGATGKANGLPVFLLIMVVEPFFSLLAGCF